MKINLIIFTALFLSACAGEEKSEAESNSRDKETSEEVLIQEKKSNENVPENTMSEPETEVKKISDLSSGGKKTEAPKTNTAPKKEDRKDVKTDYTPKEDTKVTVEDTKMTKEDFSGVFNQILTNFVSSSGKVNYAGIKTNRTMLSQATQYFEENPPQSSWSNNQKLAYWINAYNLYTIELVVDNYPVASIKDIAVGKPWDKKFINLAGKTLSLNDIENNIIRKEFNEPRIHFAVNCASISCPKLLNKAYTADNLNALLESQAKRFINDNSMNTLGSTSVEISNIFDWYKVDFIKSGTVIDYLNKYAETSINSNAKISFKEYNWNLNK
jgi:Protein of unknown function, DUF547